MRNITVTIPDDCYIRARVFAAQRDTSISAMVRYIIETLPGIPRLQRTFPVATSIPSTPTPPPGPPPSAKSAIFTGERVELNPS